jgi:hypothetical protein
MGTSLEGMMRAWEPEGLAAKTLNFSKTPQYLLTNDTLTCIISPL